MFQMLSFHHRDVGFILLHRRPCSFLIIIFLVLHCDSLHSDCVQFALAFFCDHPSTALFNLLNQAHLLKLLQNVPDHFTRCLGIDLGASAAAMFAAVDFAETTNTSALADVEFPDNRSCPYVEPVRIH